MIRQESLPGDGHHDAAHKAIHDLQRSTEGLQKLIDRLEDREEKVNKNEMSTNGSLLCVDVSRIV